MMTTFVIGPSHIHPDHLSDNDRIHYGNMILEPHCGLPVWSSRVPQAFSEVGKDMKLVWIVSDWKLNNIDYDTIVEMKKHPNKETISPHLDQLGHRGNIMRDKITPAHIEVLSKHGMRCIDSVIERFPNVKLIFWCLYYRTCKGSKSIPTFAQYDAIIERYHANAINIDDYIAREQFISHMIVDNGGHPSAAGHELLGRMIMESTR